MCVRAYVACMRAYVYERCVNVRSLCASEHSRKSRWCAGGRDSHDSAERGLGGRGAPSERLRRRTQRGTEEEGIWASGVEGGLGLQTFSGAGI